MIFGLLIPICLVILSVASGIGIVVANKNKQNSNRTLWGVVRTASITVMVISFIITIVMLWWLYELVS